MKLPDNCPFCGSGSEAGNGEKWVGFTCITTIHAGHDARRMQSITCAGFERTRLLARVAELEAREVAALARLAAKDARIESSRLENEAVRRQLGHAENACDAMEKRVTDLEARCKRLEEVGGEMADWNMNERNLGCDPELAHKWHQAKEAKP